MNQPPKKKLSKEDRRDKVMKMTLAGESTRAIAEVLGVSHSTISRDLKARLEAISKGSKEVERLRALQGARIHTLMAVQWSQATEGDETQGPTRMILQLMERQSKLLGLDAPKCMAHSGPDEVPVKPERPVKPDLSAFTDDELNMFLMLVDKIETPREEERNNY